MFTMQNYTTRTNQYQNKINLITISREYKHKINFTWRYYRNDTVNKLRKHKSNNPKEYWKIIHSIDKTNNVKIRKNIYFLRR